MGCADHVYKASAREIACTRYSRVVLIQIPDIEAVVSGHLIVDPPEVLLVERVVRQGALKLRNLNICDGVAIRYGQQRRSAEGSRIAGGISIGTVHNQSCYTGIVRKGGLQLLQSRRIRKDVPGRGKAKSSLIGSVPKGAAEEKEFVFQDRTTQSSAEVVLYKAGNNRNGAAIRRALTG